MKAKAFSLIELLVTVLVIALMASMLLGVLSKAFKTCKSVIYGAYEFNNKRIDTFLSDNSSELAMMRMATNKPFKWDFSVSPLSDYKP